LQLLFDGCSHGGFYAAFDILCFSVLAARILKDEGMPGV
jgi:hypothetical protein